MARFIEFTTTDGNRQALGEHFVINAEFVTSFYANENKEHTNITISEGNKAWEVTVAECYEEVKVMLGVEQD